MTQAAAPAQQNEAGQIKETLISVIIAFIMAFVFRAFVIEAFIIPTGSMAPTLMGQHERMLSPQTGYSWPVGPQYMYPGSSDALPVQSTVVVHDPMTGEEILRNNVPRRAGDRILVFKYLYSIYDPKRFHVVVFKAPHQPSDNYIKRLIGLPNEMIALIDGDVFVRKASRGETIPAGIDPWELPGWQVQRKPERAQRAVWQDVFSSEYQPLSPVRNAIDAAQREFRIPWVGGAGWEIEGRRDYQYAGPGPTRLTWDNQVPDARTPPRWPITDFCYYNDTNNPMTRQSRVFSVCDLNMRCGIRPESGSVDASAVIQARGHEFRADIKGVAVTLRMGPLGPAGADGQPTPPTSWTTLATGTLSRPLQPGRVTNVEFWHADQSLQLWIDDTLVAQGVYDWTPAERIGHTLGTTLVAVMDVYKKNGSNPLVEPSNYHQARLWWEFSGGPLTLYRVGLQRDIFYEPATAHTSEPARATHPMTTVLLGPDQFFVCGDNSPASLDARLWDPPDPWVARDIDPTPGIVPRDLMIGRAFFVYFPSLIRGDQSVLPVPDFGRMRWIW